MHQNRSVGSSRTKGWNPLSSMPLVFQGEVHGLSMEVLAQTQFTPLPEALCLIISELTTNTGSMASLDNILDHLRSNYYGMQQPSEHIVYETLGSLIRERKLFHTGENGRRGNVPTQLQYTIQCTIRHYWQSHSTICQLLTWKCGGLGEQLCKMEMQC